MNGRFLLLSCQERQIMGRKQVFYTYLVPEMIWMKIDARKRQNQVAYPYFDQLSERYQPLSKSISFEQFILTELVNQEEVSEQPAFLHKYGSES